MIKIISHTASKFDADSCVKGTFTTPAGKTKLAGAMIISTTILAQNNNGDDGFTLKIQVNNRRENPVNNDFNGGKDYPVFENLTEGRITDLNCELNRSEKIHYCIVCHSGVSMPKADDGSIPDTELKLYLIFE